MKIEPKFDLDEFSDEMMDAKGHRWRTKISLESCFYDGSLHIYKLQVSTSYPFTDEIEENVLNLIQIRYGKSVTMDCQLEII